MSLINRLIHEAKTGSAELRIRPQDVGRVAQHMRALNNWSGNDDAARAALLDGKVRLLGIPIRVLGVTPAPNR